MSSIPSIRARYKPPGNADSPSRRSCSCCVVSDSMASSTVKHLQSPAFLLSTTGGWRCSRWGTRRNTRRTRVERQVRESWWNCILLQMSTCQLAARQVFAPRCIAVTMLLHEVIVSKVQRTHARVLLRYKDFPRVGTNPLFAYSTLSIGNEWKVIRASEGVGLWPVYPLSQPTAQHLFTITTIV